MLIWQNSIGHYHFLSLSIIFLLIIHLFDGLFCLQHTKIPGAYCLGVFENQDPTTLLGGRFLMMHVRHGAVS